MGTLFPDGLDGYEQVTPSISQSMSQMNCGCQHTLPILVLWAAAPEEMSGEGDE